MPLPPRQKPPLVSLDRGERASRSDQGDEGPTMSDAVVLHEDRLFPSSPGDRAIARRLYGEVRDLPIISPHGHTEPAWFADDEPFADPASLLIIPDHYVFRMLYSQGVALEDLGVPARDGRRVE